MVAKVEETDTDMYQGELSATLIARTDLDPCTVERAWLQGVYARCKFGQKSFAATKDQGVNVQQDVYHGKSYSSFKTRTDIVTRTVERAWLHRIYMRCKIGERAASTEGEHMAVAISGGQGIAC